jgi:translation initiation factor 3 subunit M
LLALAGRAEQVGAVMGQFVKIDTWIAEWGIDKAQIRELYTSVHGVLLSAGKNTDAADYLVKLLKTYNGEDAAGLAGAAGAVRQLIVHSLKDQATFELSSLLGLDAVDALPADDSSKALLMVFKEGSLTSFQQWLTANPKTLGTLGIEEEELTRKVRLLNLQFLCAEHKVVDFATVATRISIAPEDVELWIIDVIRAGLVEAKVDQLNAKVYVSRAAQASFDDSSWAELKTQLDVWQENITGVQGVFRQVETKILEIGR